MPIRTIKLKRTNLAWTNDTVKNTTLDYGEPFFNKASGDLLIGDQVSGMTAGDATRYFHSVPTSVSEKSVFYNNSTLIAPSSGSYLTDENSNAVFPWTDSSYVKDGTSTVSARLSSMQSTISSIPVINVDSSISSTSTNPVQNKVIYTQLHQTKPVTEGGTGLTTASYKNSAIVSGTSATGTFQTVRSASGAFYSTGQDVKPTFGTLPVKQGGTGLTTTTNKNAVVIGNSSSADSALQTVQTNSGAFYATAQNAKPTFGTLPVAQGGTGVASLTSGAVLIGNGTGAIATRSITNNTSTTTAITGSTNLVTMNTLRSALNRTTGPESADTNYTTAMMRAIKASTTDLTAGSSSLTSGTIYLVYEV